MQATTDEDLAAGLGLLADRLSKPSSSNHSTDRLEIPQKCPKHLSHESSAAFVTMPTEVMPLPSELRSVTTSAAANHRSLITNLSVDWQTLLAQLQAGTPPTVSDPPPQTQNSAFTGTTCNGSSVPLAKKVIRLVAKRPLTSILSQSQSGASIVRSCSNSVSSTKCPPEPHDFIVSSVAEADSVVMKPTDFHTELSSQELVTSCNTGSPSGYMESSLVEGNLGSPEGHLGSFEII